MTLKNLFLGFIIFYVNSFNAQCYYQLHMYDSYGDGWNGNVLTIGDDSSYTFEEGGFASVPVGECVDLYDDGNCLMGTAITCDGGDWQEEVSWSITACDGTTIVFGGAPYVGCVVLPDNYVINMYDSYGDGWNSKLLKQERVLLLLEMILLIHWKKEDSLQFQLENVMTFMMMMETV